MTIWGKNNTLVLILNMATEKLDSLFSKFSVCEGMNLVFLWVLAVFSLFTIIFCTSCKPTDRMIFFLHFEASGSVVQLLHQR